MLVAQCYLLSLELHSALTLPECINTSASHENLIITSCDVRDRLIVHSTCLYVSNQFFTPSDLSCVYFACSNIVNTHLFATFTQIISTQSQLVRNCGNSVLFCMFVYQLVHIFTKGHQTKGTVRPEDSKAKHIQYCVKGKIKHSPDEDTDLLSFFTTCELDTQLGNLSILLL